MLGGFWGRILRIDLSARTSREEEVPQERVGLYLGGRGVAARYYYEEVPGDVQPFDPGNKLIFHTGILTGTPVPGSTKFQVATKGPETGHYLCANCGGNFGPLLKAAGYDGLIIQGKASEPVRIFIGEGGVFFHPAAEFWGLGSGQVEAALKEMYRDRKVSSISIGPAGENLVAFATIQSDQRSFGRGGSGAVMGSKNLKAVTVSGSKRVPLADPDGLRGVKPRLVKEITTSRDSLRRFGRNLIIDTTQEFGLLPTRNWRQGVFEGYPQLSALRLREEYLQSNRTCYNCPLACWQVGEAKEGPYKGATSDPEYETLWAMGPACGISDYSAILAGNQLCDELGLDTITMGQLVALVMDMGERGLLDADPASWGGGRPGFGNDDLLLELIRRTANRQGLGDLLADGFRGVKAKWPQAEPLMVEVKGMPPAGYDPRAVIGMALAYGTSNRGACHNVGGWTVREELGGELDRYSPEGKADLVRRVQDTRAYIDSLGICTELRRALGFTYPATGEILRLVAGEDLTPQLVTMGARIYSLERLLLVREGITRKDDLIAPRLMHDPLEAGPAAGRVVPEQDYQRMLSEYYQLRGWDEEGRPEPATVKQLCSDL